MTDADEKRDRLDAISARYVISPELVKAFKEATAKAFASTKRPRKRPRLWVIIELNLDEARGRYDAHVQVLNLINGLQAEHPGIETRLEEGSRHHVFAKLTRAEVQRIVQMDAESVDNAPAIYKVWPDREIEPFLNRSVRAIKADACLRSFGSDGRAIVWAVADSGIDGEHLHFARYKNLVPPVMGVAPARSGRQTRVSPIKHKDFTISKQAADAAVQDDGDPSAKTDVFGHGTHVAGIIAGIAPVDPALEDAEPADRDPKDAKAFRITRHRNRRNEVSNRVDPQWSELTGVAPRAKLVSLKVLDDEGRGQESGLLAAIDYIARINDDGRWLRIHGLNLSLGYGFDAEWFAAGHSPLCVAVNRLVKQGVVVVAAAGNDGSALLQTEMGRAARRVGLDQTIADPGNAELAITVGSTHPEQPHTYGISYFSSRGPTADGRQKPDLVAPGERILSCASSATVDALKDHPSLRGEKLMSRPKAAYYREDSGTSMAAPHVSGAVAAFLSVRREFIGQPERVKEIFMETATDLKRRREFQGAGLLDLLRAIQSV